MKWKLVFGIVLFCCVVIMPVAAWDETIIVNNPTFGDKNYSYISGYSCEYLYTFNNPVDDFQIDVVVSGSTNNAKIVSLYSHVNSQGSPTGVRYMDYTTNGGFWFCVGDRVRDSDDVYLGHTLSSRTMSLRRSGPVYSVFEEGVQRITTNTWYDDLETYTLLKYFWSGFPEGEITVESITYNVNYTDVTPTPTATTGTPTPTPTVSGETTINWDKSSYYEGTTAIITYYIRDSDWDTDNYNYYGRIVDTDGVQVLEEWDINTQPSGSTYDIFVESSTFDTPGSYYCVLIAKSKATQNEIELDYDAAYINIFNYVDITGTTIDAVNSTALGAVNVSISQTGDTSYVTSSTWGLYGKTGLYDSFWIALNGTKTGWTCSPFGFTPEGTGEYTINLYLVPDGGAEPGGWENTGDGSAATNTTYSNTNTSYWSPEVFGSAIGGYVYGGLLNNAALPDATITINNATWNTSQTSSSDGWYMFSETDDGMIPGSYTITCSQTGYETSTSTISVLEDYFGRKDFYLAVGEYTYTDDSSSAENTSYWNTAEGTACGGIVYHGELWDADGGDLITISNDTWSNTTTTDTGGWWKFDESDGLWDDETYYIEVVHTGYSTVNTPIKCVADNFTRKDFHLIEEYSLVVHVKDSETASYITTGNVTVILGEETAYPTDGTAEFSDLTYGSYALYVSADGYYASTGYTVVDSASDSETVYLTKESEPGDSGPSANYYPHTVRFTFVDTWGNPITGATVTAEAISSSTPWTWLSGVFGFDESSVDIRNESFTAYTDSSGTVTFLMVESVQYSINCVKGSESLDHTIQIYPKESEYFIRIGTLPLATDYPEYDITAYSVNDSYVRLSVNFTDAANQTTALAFNVNYVNGTSLYTTNVTLTDGVGSTYYDVENTKGTSLEVGITATNTVHSTIEAYKGVDLKGTGKLVDFGWPDLWYILISFAGILIVAGSIGEMDVKVGAIMVPITAGMFWYIGWMPGIAAAIITLIFFVGGIYYLRSSITKVDQ